MDLLVEVDPRRRAHAADCQGATLAQIHLVQVRLEDLILRIAPVDPGREPRLADLADVGTFRREQTVLDELLGDRAPTLGDPSRSEIAPGRADHAPQGG